MLGLGGFGATIEVVRAQVLIVGWLSRHLVMENETSIGIDSGLQIIGWALWSIANWASASALDQRVTSFGVEPGSQAVELGSPFSEYLERRSRRA